MTEALRKPLVEVLTGRLPERRPVWLMRQAGRYLPEYREVRGKAGSFLNLCYSPRLAAEVTLQPLRRFDLDAAILFSDILVVPHAMGLEVEFLENEGPRVQIVRDHGSVEALKSGLESWHFGSVFESVALLRSELKDSRIALLGFCGAPWTVASYMIEGGGGDRRQALAVARDNPLWFQLLLEKLVQTSIGYLLGQIKAGVDAVQIFDSWAGDVPDDMRARLVCEPIAQIISGIRADHPGFPVIVFARGIGGKHGGLARETGASCMGVEEGVRMADVLLSLPHHCAVQGNLAPAALSDPRIDLARAVDEILTAVPKRRHVFNLGHGIRPDASPMRVGELIGFIRHWDGD